MHCPWFHYLFVFRLNFPKYFYHKISGLFGVPAGRKKCPLACWGRYCRSRHRDEATQKHAERWSYLCAPNHNLGVHYDRQRVLLREMLCTWVVVYNSPSSGCRHQTSKRHISIQRHRGTNREHDSISRCSFVRWVNCARCSRDYHGDREGILNVADRERRCTRIVSELHLNLRKRKIWRQDSS